MPLLRKGEALLADFALDPFDVALLNALQADAGATAEALAGRVALSPSAIGRRVRRLRASGAIAAEVAIVAPALLERQLSALVQVQLHEHARHRGLDDLRARLAAAPEVQLCLEVSGACDLLLLVTVRDMRAYNAFADAMLAGNEVVRRYETSFVKKTVKRTLAVPLDAADLG